MLIAICFAFANCSLLTASCLFLPMNLLLCAATPFEIDPLVQLISKENIRDVDVLITGVGLTATTHALTKAVLTKRPRFIMQAGVAGCINKQLPLTKVVIVENETYKYCCRVR